MIERTKINVHARGTLPFRNGGLVVALPPESGLELGSLDSSDPTVRDAAWTAVVFGECIRRDDASVTIFDLEHEIEREFSVLDVVATSPTLEIWLRAMSEKDEADWWKGQNDAGGGAADRA